MKELYSKILDLLQEGYPAALVTGIPWEVPGILEKQVIEFTEDYNAVPQHIKETIEAGLPALIDIDGRIVLVEPIFPKERLIVLGGGHIALPLVRFAAETGFNVTVVDDRPAFANTSRFPKAEQVICLPFEDSFDKLKLTEYDYVVIITRGHKHDALCLRKIFESRETYYLGLIGSRRRVRGLKDMLIEEGLDSERLERICSPIGLNIGAITPEEIAVSILAELISKKRMGNGRRKTANRSELDLEVLEEIVSGKKGNAFSSVTVMETKGSSPRGPGAKMLVYPDLSIAGSIGGGCSEAEVIRDALNIIGTGGYLVRDIDLTGDVAESEGMVCGGIMKVLIEDLTE